MGNYRVITGQNIYDVALHLYGSIEGIVDLLVNNPDLHWKRNSATGTRNLYLYRRISSSCRCGRL